MWCERGILNKFLFSMWLFNYFYSKIDLKTKKEKLKFILPPAPPMMGGGNGGEELPFFCFFLTIF